MGLLKFTPGVWARIETELAAMDPAMRDRLDMTGFLGRLLEAGVPISTLATCGQWGEVDNPSDLALYERMAASGELVLEG
jgi:hypothetical protein